VEERGEPLKGRLAGVAIVSMVGASLAWASTATSSSVGSEEPPRCAGSSEGLVRLQEDLDTRERTLSFREASFEDERADLDVAKAELTALIAELEAVRVQAETALSGVDEADEARLVETAKRLDSMKTKAAADTMAALFADDADRAVAVFDRMNRTKVGKMLSSLTPTVAARLLKQSSRPMALAER
jgi:hypothetical protein